MITIKKFCKMLKICLTEKFRSKIILNEDYKNNIVVQ